jgi:D-lactate dehydrogenase
MSVQKSLINDFLNFIPKERVFWDEISLSSVSTDASFYQLKPKVIIDVLSSDEVKKTFEICLKNKIGITFRAGGTSLSGQSQGDGVLLRISRGFKEIKVLENGDKISLGPGVIGGHANRSLKSFSKKIGPDPASIQSCMIGGIAANNASGMCCGTDQNTYKTMSSLKMILAPRNNFGLIPSLDTSNPESIAQFKLSFPEIINELKNIKQEIEANNKLKKLIIEKYKIKNTMGYALNSLVDFDDPIDILSHLLIGSEGTLGFISEITYKTVEDHKYKACALVFFHSLFEACEAASILRSCPIAACELMDRTSLKSVENKKGMPEILKTLPEGVCALLIETRSENSEKLNQDIEIVKSVLNKLNLFSSPLFSNDPIVFDSWWNIRRGLFPAVGMGRPPGTTVIIEDIAFKRENLAEAAVDLSKILKEHGYDKAILFGHVLDGNLHFCFSQNFEIQSEIDRYEKMMDAVGILVTKKFLGSLKAEHGTGRNMAPFVRQEWGDEAYLIMEKIKKLLDPLGLLNPGVILNSNSKAHLENLKICPSVDPLIDECIECGFCEVNCPSKDLTITPRQRIATFRSLHRLKNKKDMSHFEKEMSYVVNETCATDGLCSTSCPVGIDTGLFIKKYRSLPQNIKRNETLALLLANNFNTLLKLIHLSLRIYSFIPLLITNKISRIKKLNFLPWIPLASKKCEMISQTPSENNLTIVYFSSCISRTMGPSKMDSNDKSLVETHLSLFNSAKINVLIPKNISSLCCGLPFESKGFPQSADLKLKELEFELNELSENGKFPIVSDTSPCTSRMIKKLNPKLKILDSIQFIDLYLLDEKNPKIKINQNDEAIALHITCSAKHMGIEKSMLKIAHRCSSKVIVPDDVGCCGFAGDKGFSHPELNDKALMHLNEQVKDKCEVGYSNSRTCEIGLSKTANFPYKSLIYAVENQKSN